MPHSHQSASRLSVRQLQSRFAGPFSFDLNAGECLVIQGPSGAGKSVLLRMLADLDPHDGDVLLDGVESRAMSGPVWRRQVVYQAAEPAWWEPSAQAHFPAARLQAAMNLMTELGLAHDLLRTDISRLSTGQRQRLALVRSLLTEPQVLLLDEPTAALNPEAVTAVERLLAIRLAQGVAILLVTHSDEQARRLADRILKIEQGKLQSS